MNGMIEHTEAERKLAACQQRLESATGAIGRAVAMAAAIRTAKAIVDANIDEFMALAGTPLGFAVDKPGGYSKEQIGACVMAALVNGDSPIGNEWAIIGGRYYRQLAGWESAFNRVPNSTVPIYRIGNVETITQPTWDDKTQRAVLGIAKVEATIEFTVRGEIFSVQFLDNTQSGGLDERLLIRVNKGMGDDAIIGKAKARLMKALYRQYRGESRQSPADDDVIDSTATVEPVRAIEAEPKPETKSKLNSVDEFERRLSACKSVQEMMVEGADFEFASKADDAKARTIWARRKKELEGGAA